MTDIVINTRQTSSYAYKLYLQSQGIPILKEYGGGGEYVFNIPNPPEGYEYSIRRSLSQDYQNALFNNEKVAQDQVLKQQAFTQAALESGTGKSTAEINPATGKLEGYETYTPQAKIQSSAESPFNYSVTQDAVNAGFNKMAIEPKAAPNKPFVIETYADYPEQATDILSWANKQPGVSANRVADSTGKGIKIEIHSEQPLTKPNPITGSEWIYPYNQPTVRSENQIKSERANVESTGLAELAYDNANPWEKIGLGLHTLFTPQGHDQLGMAVLGGDASKIVKQRLAEDIKADSNWLVDFAQSPIFEIEASYAVGAGTALVSSTKIGTLVVGSKVGKVALAGLGVAYAGEVGLDVAGSYMSGNTAGAVGKGLTGLASALSGIKGFKNQVSYQVSASPPSQEVDISTAEMKGTSTTISLGENQMLSQGKFEIVKGKLTGVKGTTHEVSNPKKGRGMIVTNIPEQKIPIMEKVKEFKVMNTPEGKVSEFSASQRKIGEIKVKAQTHSEYVESLPDISIPQPSSEPIKIFVRQGANLKLKVNEVFAKLVGPEKSKIYMQKLAEVKVALSDGDSAVYRKFSGIGEKSEASKYWLELRKSEAKTIAIEESTISKKSISKIDWVDREIVKADIGDMVRSSKVRSQGEISTRSGSLESPQKSVQKVELKELPPIPSGRVEYQTKIELPSRPMVGNAAQGAIKAVQMVNVKSVTESAQKTVQRQGISLSQSLMTMPMEIQGLKDIQTQRLKLVQIAIQEPITIQRSLQKQAVLTREMPLTELMALPPIPNVPIIPSEGPPIGIPGMAIPFFGLGSSKFRRSGKAVIKNPIPDIKDLIKMKLNLKGVI